jgi:hypothetical protein
VVLEVELEERRERLDGRLQPTSGAEPDDVRRTRVAGAKGRPRSAGRLGVTSKAVKLWAVETDLLVEVPRGNVKGEIIDAYERAHDGS